VLFKINLNFNFWYQISSIPKNHMIQLKDGELLKILLDLLKILLDILFGDIIMLKILVMQLASGI